MIPLLLLPGSYDPVTRGHLAVIDLAASLAQEVRVMIFINPDKHCLFSLEQRLSFLRLALKDRANVTVGASSGMVADYCREHGVTAILKGVRNETDFLYEQRMADYNRAHGAKTLLLPSPPDCAAVSSSEVRRRLESGLPIGELLPEGLASAVTAAYSAASPA